MNLLTLCDTYARTSIHTHIKTSLWCGCSVFIKQQSFLKQPHEGNEKQYLVCVFLINTHTHTHTKSTHSKTRIAPKRFQQMLYVKITIKLNKIQSLYWFVRTVVVVVQFHQIQNSTTGPLCERSDWVAFYRITLKVKTRQTKVEHPGTNETSCGPASTESISYKTIQ